MGVWNFRVPGLQSQGVPSREAGRGTQSPEELVAASPTPPHTPQKGHLRPATRFSSRSPRLCGHQPVPSLRYPPRRGLDKARDQRPSAGSALEWVAMPSSRGSSHPRDGTHVSVSYVSCIGGWVLYSFAGRCPPALSLVSSLGPRLPCARYLLPSDVLLLPS